MNSIYNLTK